MHGPIKAFMSCSHPEGATDAMQSSLTEPMLNNTGNASSTQRLLEGQADATTTAKTLTKPDAWVQAGKTLFQRASGGLSMHTSTAAGLHMVSCSAYGQAAPGLSDS